MELWVQLYIVVLLIFLRVGATFQLGKVIQERVSLRRMTMEYIPDGISKEKWAEMKKKEAEEKKNKDLSKVGITKFKSRSFEAWQKSGQSHLFPVDPKTPLERRPYMQRKDGSADGSDLAKLGKKGMDQAKPSAKTEVDALYERLNKESRVNPFPWTAEAASKLFAGKGGNSTSTAYAQKKPQRGDTSEAPPVSPKKGFFGLF
jgi:hypothetical protein